MYARIGNLVEPAPHMNVCRINVEPQPARSEGGRERHDEA
jgi:hypothetical protein